MPRRPLRTALSTLVLSCGLVAGGLLVAPAAQAATEVPPTTADDTATIDAGDVVVVDVLANDSDGDADPDGANLAVCRTVVPARSPLSVDVRDGGIAVSSRITAAGTYSLYYYACNYTYLTRATLTVTIKAVPAVTARKTTRPAHVQFTNPGDQAVKVSYTVPSGQGPEGHVTVPARSARTVTVTRSTIDFVAVRASGAVVGYGTVRNIKIPHRSRAV